MNQKQQLENDIKELETKLNEMKATVATMPPEAPARWVPEFGDRYCYIDSDGVVRPDTYAKAGWQLRRIKLGNCYPNNEDGKAQAYRELLRLESFVPALGPETPPKEVLDTGFYFVTSGYSHTILSASVHPEFASTSYQNGTWHPTREAAEAWLAKYGKVRGYTK